MYQQLDFPRRTCNLHAFVDNLGVTFEADESVAIPKPLAIEHVKTFDSYPSVGFFKCNGEVVLSHGRARIHLSEQEAQAVVGLIEGAYGPF